MGKILQKILPRALQEKTKIEFYTITDLENYRRAKNFLFTEILSKVATRDKISYIVLPVSPLVFPSTFIKKLKLRIYELGLIPFIPLSGIGLEIFENAKEVGLEKYIGKIEKILRTKIEEKRMKKLSDKALDNIIKSKKTVSVKLGPNMLHEMLDALEVEH